MSHLPYGRVLHNPRDLPALHSRSEHDLRDQFVLDSYRSGFRVPKRSSTSPFLLVLPSGRFVKARIQIGIGQYFWAALIDHLPQGPTVFSKERRSSVESQNKPGVIPAENSELAHQPSAGSIFPWPRTPWDEIVRIEYVVKLGRTTKTKLHILQDVDSLWREVLVQCRRKLRVYDWLDHTHLDSIRASPTPGRHVPATANPKELVA
jgi:hypothetical protein